MTAKAALLKRAEDEAAGRAKTAEAAKVDPEEMYVKEIVDTTDLVRRKKKQFKAAETMLRELKAMSIKDYKQYRGI